METQAVVFDLCTQQLNEDTLIGQISTDARTSPLFSVQYCLVGVRCIGSYLLFAWNFLQA
jgi:hypothetical protein